MNSAVLALKHRGTYTVLSRDFPSFRPQGFSLKGSALRGRYCHVELVLRKLWLGASLESELS